MSKHKEIIISLPEDIMYNAEAIANILETTLEDLAGEILLSYIQNIEKSIRNGNHFLYCTI